MKNLIFSLIILTIPLTSFSSNLMNCFKNSVNSIEFESCLKNNLSSENPENYHIDLKIDDPDYDCSVYRNYRGPDGKFTCPTTDYDACLKEYGPRLPPPYFGFVKQWCWCNCVYNPDEL